MAQAVKLSKTGVDADNNPITITVEIAAEKVEHDVIDNLIKFPTPVLGSSKQDKTVPGVFLADIKQVVNTITITGYLLSDANSSALEKKQALVSLETLPSDHSLAPNSIGAVWKHGPFTLTWRNETFTAYLDKLKIVDEASRKDRSGYCSNPNYKTQSECEAAGEKWFPSGADKYKIIITLTLKPT